ncbi:hypothetical protein F0562_025121 [Nyssa sinensis]|uniref:Strictosidine synthase conserved region domain-containing protein n=1 Tax=Nyssa sinensis TaxID=561372 RepID=A0A5J5BDI2_9ASTE|nr:hypothetical protein F0562_025121 [Nyssa sinensis]
MLVSQMVESSSGKVPNIGWVDFAITSPNRNKQPCDGTTDPNLGPICGRPLGFSFYLLTGDLYIVDAFLGLYVVGPKGGLATRLSTSADGVPFRSLDGIDVDQFTGIVYFSDATTTYDLRNISQPNFTPDSTGRLLKYDPRSKQVTVLLKDLSVPIGPAISIDGTSIFFSEYTTKRILRYWLIGLKAKTVEICLNLPGNPSKVKRSTQGNFIVAVDVRTQQRTTLITPLGLRFNTCAMVPETLNFSAQYYNTTISVVQEQNGKIFIGSRFTNFVGIYS